MRKRYRGPELTRLSEFKGKRLAIGRDGSGTHQIVLLLLGANGVEGNGDAQMVPIEGEVAVNALLDGKVDAAFLTPDSARHTRIAVHTAALCLACQIALLPALRST